MRWTASSVLRDRLLAAPESLDVNVVGHWMQEVLDGESTDYLDDPGLTGDVLIDTLVAASADRVALLRGDDRPAWLSEPGRALSTIWHPGLAALLPWTFGDLYTPPWQDVRSVAVTAAGQLRSFEECLRSRPPGTRRAPPGTPAPRVAPPGGGG